MTVTELCKRYGPYLLDRIKWYGLGKEDAEDVRQDIYLTLLTKYGDTLPVQVEMPKGWLSKVVHDAVIDWQRKAGRSVDTVPLSILTECGGEGEHPDVDTQSLELWVKHMDSNSWDRLTQALERARTYHMAPDVTAYDVLAHIEYGMSTGQIGQYYGVTPETVRRWVRQWKAFARQKWPANGT